MTRKTKTSTVVITFFISIISYAQNSKAVTEYLNIPGPVILNKDTFRLAWSAHPSSAYYKQEYVGSKDKVEKFKKMVLAEVLVGETKAADLAKWTNLNSLK
jgi:hypothetical protein